VKKKVLLTGGSGFLGHIIANQLKELYNITLLHRTVDIEIEKCFPVIYSDLSKELIPQRFNNNWDIILHAAGKSGTSLENLVEDDKFYNANVIGTKNLLSSLENRLPKLFVYFSSVSVYGVEEGEDVDENHPTNAIDAYGNSKLEAEHEVLKWSKRTGVNCIILRLPLLVGPKPPGNLGKMIHAIKKRKYVSIGGGKARKSMVWIKDIGSLIPTIEDKEGIYNLTDQHHPSFRELENIISENVGCNIWTIPNWIAKYLSKFGSWINKFNQEPKFPLDYSTYLKITKSVTFDDSKAVKELHWKPQRVLEKMKQMDFE